MEKRAYIRRKPLTGVIKQCMNCKNEFYCKRHLIETRKYCSIKCAHIKQIGKSHPNNRRKMTETEKARRRELLKEKPNPFLGKKHTLETRKILSAIKQGIKTEEWSNFKRPQNYAQRRLFKAQIQKKVLERDKYRCQICGDEGGDLQVDHIQPWAEYIELRFNINNCRTLCVKCHYQITFGKPMPPTIKAWGHNFLKGGNNL